MIVCLVVQPLSLSTIALDVSADSKQSYKQKRQMGFGTELVQSRVKKTQD